MQASEAVLLVVASLVLGLDTNLVHAEGAPDLSVCRLNRTLEMIERCLADSGVSSIREAMSLSPAKLFQEGQDKGVRNSPKTIFVWLSYLWSVWQTT